MTDVQFFIFCYLIGGVPTSWLLSKLISKDKEGRKYELYALDMAKGFIPLLVLREFGQAPDIDYHYWAVFWVVMGDMFSPYLNFKGGKGVAALFGALLVFNPVAALGMGAVYAAALFAVRYECLALFAASVACYAQLLFVATETRDPYATTFLIVFAVFAKLFVHFKGIFNGSEPKWNGKIKNE